MQFGVTILPDPPCSRFVELVQAAEASGYHWAYTYDSHILWQDGSAFLAAAAARTESTRSCCASSCSCSRLIVSSALAWAMPGLYLEATGPRS